MLWPFEESRTKSQHYWFFKNPTSCYTGFETGCKPVLFLLRVRKHNELKKLPYTLKTLKIANNHSNPPNIAKPSKLDISQFLKQLANLTAQWWSLLVSFEGGGGTPDTWGLVWSTNQIVVLSQDECFSVLFHLDLPSVQLFRGCAIQTQQLVRVHHQLHLLPRRREPIALCQRVGWKTRKTCNWLFFLAPLLLFFSWWVA